MSFALDNYLRTYRRRACLSQEELSYLLGLSSDTKISRIERRHRKPDLETAFACQSIFSVPAHEMFPGFYAEVEQTIITRARSLRKKLEQCPQNAKTKHKIEQLDDLLRRADAH